MGKIILFTAVTIFQRFFSLCIVYESVCTPEHIYFVYHNYPVIESDKDFGSGLFCSGETDTPQFSSDENYENRVFVEFLFYCYEIQDVGTMKEGT
jgi:hypothetical protein